MSAIVGLLYRDARPVERETIERMLSSVVHRGPDGEGVWTAGPIGLGHRMLRTTTESLYERLPETLDDGRLVITADARIDNRRELLDDLHLADRLMPDSALILRAYERWRDACVDHLLGDFAFAIWDRDRRQFFCVRDHFGVKPFFYYESGAMFAFASEIKAILALTDVPRRVNEIAVGDHLMRSFDDPEITFYQGLRRLPAAHARCVGLEDAQQRRYWALNPSRELDISDGEAISELRRLFVAAVSFRLRSTTPVASTLSGGLDSTAVACTARTLLGGGAATPIHTVSAVFNHAIQADERAWIEPALAGGGFSPHFVIADDLDPLADLDRMLHHEDGVFHAPNLYLHWALYRAASGAGCRVFLDGLDGDSTVSHGQDYPRELMIRGHWIQLWRETRAYARLRQRSLRSQAREWGVPWHAPAFRLLRQGAKRVLKPGTAPSEPGWQRFELLNPAFVERAALRERFLQRSGHRLHLPCSEREGHYRQISWPLQTNVLEYCDHAAAAFGLEPRYPFFDVRLAEFCLALPGRLKLRDGWTRWVMRRAMEGILPHEVQWRVEKSNLSPMLTRGLSLYGRTAIDNLLAAPDTIAPYVDLDYVRSAWSRFSSQPDPRLVMTLWLPLVLARGLESGGLSRQTTVEPGLRYAERDSAVRVDAAVSP